MLKERKAEREIRGVRSGREEQSTAAQVQDRKVCKTQLLRGV